MSPDIAPAPPLATEPRGPVQSELQRQAATTLGQRQFRLVWFAALLAAICFEGLGRRYLPQIPATVFYFLKDAVLLVGFARFRINRQTVAIVRHLYGRFLPFLTLAVVWTFVEIFNPDNQSLLLGLLGLRAYWFWWIAPFVVASVLSDPAVRRKAVFVLAAVTVVVALFAVLQFNAPATDTVNTYTVVNGKTLQAFTVGSTQRARVSSTFAFLTGFTAFVSMIPALLLSIGLGESDRKARLAALVATVLAAATLPMAGSRGPIVIGFVLCALVAWRAGLVFTRAGRRIVVLVALAAFATVFAFPDAIQGVINRFNGGDTEDRFISALEVLPPVAMTNNDFPFFGSGTGMEQNYRSQLGVTDDNATWVEGEAGKQLVELGAIGHLLVWMAKLGLAVSLWKASRILKLAGRRAAAGAALAYVILTFFGAHPFDHYYSSLYFLGMGFILQELVQAWPVAFGNRPFARGASAVRTTTEQTRVSAQPAS
jgi:hypothetical protein